MFVILNGVHALIHFTFPFLDLIMHFVLPILAFVPKRSVS